MKFSIKQLKFANEVCFPDRFETLLRKHLPPKEHDMIEHYLYKFNRVHEGNLFTWIFSFSRATDEKTYWGEVHDKIIADLVKDYS